MNKDRLMQVLLSPVISEKSSMAADQANQYAFSVAPGASKPEIRRAVELMFDVQVEAVRVANLKGKAKRFGAIQGKRSGTRKAYVRLKAGQEIDFASGA